MCWFKKKEKKQPINSKYQRGDYVNFRHRDELSFGWIWGIYQREVDGVLTVVYDIQIGGQCPAVVSGVPESRVIGLKKN